MSRAIPASTKTFVKFLFWYVLALVLEQTIQSVANIGIPDAFVPVAAAILKTIATYVATKRQESQIG
jgi:hypothetical protein